MRIHVCANYAGLSRLAANHIADVVRRQPQAVLILAAGATPLGAYATLARMVVAGELDLSQAQVFALDEWGGLPRAHPASCHATLLEHAAGPLRLAPGCFHTLDGAAPDPAAECRRFAAALAAAGPPGLALVGLGVNGHIGFNEPADELLAEAGVTPLAPETAARLRPDLAGQPLPAYGLTLSLVEVMQAAEVLLLANGAHKAQPVRQALAGSLTTHCPASLLRLHPRLTIMLDEEAAAALPPALRSGPEAVP